MRPADTTRPLLLLLLRCRRGVTAVEYGLITSLIALTLLSGATVMGQHLSMVLTDLGTFLGTIVH